MRATTIKELKKKIKKYYYSSHLVPEEPPDVRVECFLDSTQPEGFRTEYIVTIKPRIF